MLSSSLFLTRLYCDTEKERSFVHESCLWMRRLMSSTAPVVAGIMAVRILCIGSVVFILAGVDHDDEVKRSFF